MAGGGGAGVSCLVAGGWLGSLVRGVLDWASSCRGRFTRVISIYFEWMTRCEKVMAAAKRQRKAFTRSERNAPMMSRFRSESRPPTIASALLQGFCFRRNREMGDSNRLRSIDTTNHQSVRNDLVRIDDKRGGRRATTDQSE